MVEVGSMEVVGVYRDAGLQIGIESTKNKMKATADQAKILKEETHLLQKVAQEAAASFGEIAIESKEVGKLKEIFEEAIPDVKDIIIKTKVEGTEEIEDLKAIYEEAAASFGSFSVEVEAEELEELKRIYEEAAAAAQNFGGLQFGGLVDELKDVENKTKNVSVSMKRLKAVVLTAGVAMAGLALGFLSMLKNAIGSSPYLIGALTRIKTDLMLMGWALSKHLKPAFDLLADAIHALRKGDWGFFKTKVKEAWDYFIGVVKGAWNWIKEHSPEWISNIMQTLENMANKIIGFDWKGKGLWAGFKNVIKTVWDEVIDPLLPEWLSDLISALGAWIDKNGSSIATTFNHIWDLISWNDAGQSIIKDIWQGIKDWKSGKSKDWDTWWYNVGFGWGESIKNGIKAALGVSLKTLFPSLGPTSDIIDSVKGAVVGYKDKSSSATTATTSSGKSGSGFSTSGISTSSTGSITSTISSVVSTVKDTVSNIASGIVSGVASGIGSVVSTVKDTVSSAITGITSAAKKTWTKMKTFFKKAEIGSYVPSDGLIYAHAGEEIIPANSNRQTNQSPEANIILDFAGAVINLASGIDLDTFAEEISRKIADQQSWSQY